MRVKRRTTWAHVESTNSNGALSERKEKRLLNFFFFFSRIFICCASIRYSIVSHKTVLSLLFVRFGFGILFSKSDPRVSTVTEKLIADARHYCVVATIAFAVHLQFDVFRFEYNSRAIELVSERMLPTRLGVRPF